MCEHRGRDGQREKERNPSRLPDEWGAWYGAPTHKAEIMTWAKVQSQTPNRLGHPGALKAELLTIYVVTTWGQRHQFPSFFQPGYFRRPSLHSQQGCQLTELALSRQLKLVLSVRNEANCHFLITFLGKHLPRGDWFIEIRHSLWSSHSNGFTLLSVSKPYFCSPLPVLAQFVPPGMYFGQGILPKQHHRGSKVYLRKFSVHSSIFWGLCSLSLLSFLSSGPRGASKTFLGSLLTFNKQRTA